MEKEKNNKREHGCWGSGEYTAWEWPERTSGVSETDPNRSLGYRVDTSVETRKETPTMYAFRSIHFTS